MSLIVLVKSYFLESYKCRNTQLILYYKWACWKKSPSDDLAKGIIEVDIRLADISVKDSIVNIILPPDSTGDTKGDEDEFHDSSNIDEYYDGDNDELTFIGIWCVEVFNEGLVNIVSFYIKSIVDSNNNSSVTLYIDTYIL